MSIRFAIIGFGNIGSRHATHIQENSYTQLIAVCDTRLQLQDKVPQGVAFYTRVEDMLAGEEVDVVCICTPNYLHEQHTIQVLNSGKHAVVEKPMAMSVQECDRMIAAARQHNRLIFAVKQNRYNPPVQAVKALLEKGELGRINMLQVNCFWNRGDYYYAESDWRGKKLKDGGCLFTQFSHFIDILYYLNGKVSDIKGTIDNYQHRHNTEVEDSGSFVMRAANGGIVNFNFTTCAYEKNMEGAFTLFCEKGTLKIGGQYLNTIEYQQLASTELPPINITSKANDYGLYQGSMSNHDKVIQNVVDVLLYKHPIMTTAEEGRDVVAIIEAMYKAAKA